jgi:hypothetical protein
MRNIFDQYTQNENRLTHALASALSLDINLRRCFLRDFLGVKDASRAKRISVSEQSYPGQPSMSEEDAERVGIPDIWLFDDDEWCAVFECKITAVLRGEQVSRHMRIARKRGFRNILPVVISIEKCVDQLPEQAILLRWSQIYSWLISHSQANSWSEIAARYFETLEARMIESGQLERGTLTTFTGFPFAKPEDYSYGEAKRVLRLALDELAKDNRLVCEIGIDPRIVGRGAIKGRNLDNVWDVLQRGEARDAETHTSQVHLTLSVTSRHVAAWTVVPNGLDLKVRRNFSGMTNEKYLSVLAALMEKMRAVLETAPLASPSIMVLQRRWLVRSQPPVIDCELTFDMRTALPGGGIKFQPQWAQATYSALSNRNSNLEVLFGVVFAYDRCPEIRDRRAIELLSAGWRACTPIFEVAYPSRQ